MPSKAPSPRFKRCARKNLMTRKPLQNCSKSMTAYTELSKDINSSRKAMLMELPKFLKALLARRLESARLQTTSFH